jgi:hypothetical protein
MGRSAQSAPPLCAPSKRAVEYVTTVLQVNSVLPGPVMRGRRRSYLERWAPLHK